MSTFGEMVAELECPTCGALLRELVPGHQLRCAAYRDARRRRSILATVVLLVLAAFVLCAFPAHAQTLDPSVLQQGFTTAPLATSVVVLLIAVGYLFRELRATERARIEDLSGNFERLIAYGDQVARLSHTSLEAVGVVERLSDKVQDQQQQIGVLQKQLADERARRPS